MVLAAVAAVTAGSASTASARFGGGGHFGGGAHFGGGGGHFGHFGGGFGHPGFAHFGHDRFVGHRFGPRFGVFGVGYPYGYGDGCYSRVWTPWGWRWQYVCY
jgi:hypothetical protein